ncbi:hypothetical protein HKX48_002491 [Thoreauomyces humboldtii]|nr:hypothetical protein HKX48_002491 [Thoreauomyces humboldtii]
MTDWVIKAQNIGRGLPPPPVPDLSQVSYPAVLKQSGMSGGTPLIKPSALPANNHPTAPLPQYHAAQPNGIADPAYVPAALAQMHARNQAGGSFQSVHGNSLHQNQIQNAQTFGTGGQPLSQGAHQVYGAARPTPAVHSNSQQSQQSQQAQATQQAYANVQRGLPPGFQQSQAAFQSLQPPTYPNAPPAAWMQQAMQQQQLQQQQQQQSQSQTQPQMPIQLQSQQQHQQPQPQYANVQPNYASAQRAPSAPTVHPPLQQSVNGWSPAADHRQMQRPGSGSTPADPRPPSPTSLTPTQNEQQQHQQQQHHHQHQQRSQPDEAESARSAASAPGDAHSGKADSGDDSGGGSDPGNS